MTMARISKFETNGLNTPRPNGEWRAGLYVRLSREDGDRAESESVASQKALLSRFAEERNLPFEFYIDDGWSGTDFDRPSFRRMIADVTSKKINCVVVKDLSRFGRNYVESGKYLETVFPLFHVRFIAVNDGIDSEENPQSMNTVLVPFKNILNDEYCRDISVKVRSALDIRRKQGKFIGSFAAYGYRKDENDHNRLVVDETAAEIVREIYRKFLSGYSVLGIARELNGRGVPNPSVYRGGGGNNSGRWADSTVRRILTSEVYIGNLVQKKNEIVSYKIHVSRGVSEERRIRAEHTHEAIISEEDFNRVKSLLGRDTRTSPKSGTLSLFAGFLKCADCGRAMQKRTVKQHYKTYHYYVCSTYKKMHSTLCSKHAIRADALEEAVLEALNGYIAIAVNFERVKEQIGKSARDGVRERLNSELSAKMRERERVRGLLIDLYPDYKNGLLSREQYFALKEKYELRAEKIDAETEVLRAEIERNASGQSEAEAFAQSLVSYRGLRKLTRDAVTELVENIYVHENGEIDLCLRCKDALSAAEEFLRQHSFAQSSAVGGENIKVEI